MKARTIAWTLVGLDVLLWALALVFLLLPRVQPFPQETATSPFVLLAMVAFATVGAAIVSRHPRHLVGWIYCVSGLLIALELVTGSYYGHALADPSAPLGWLAQDLNGVFFWNGFLLPLTLGLLLFPDGRLPSRRWLPLAALVVGVLALFSIGPVAANASGANEDVPAPAIIAAVVAVVGVAASVVVRWRRARELERAQLKWVGAAAPVFVVALLVAIASGTGLGVTDDVVSYLAFLLVSLTFLLIPLSIGVAILRYRLYDIDVLINRGLVYGALTASLLLTYAVAVLVLQLALRPFTSGNELAVAASTLVVAALFQPLRARIHSAVDRRFYRSKYDAERTVDAFRTRLRDETDLAALERELLGVLGATVGPAGASLWLRNAPGTPRREDASRTRILSGGTIDG